MNSQSPATLVPSTFTDFPASEVSRIAASRGYNYTELESSVSFTPNIYENPRTNGLQIHKMSFAIDDLSCEYYAAWYIPIVISDASGGLEEETRPTASKERTTVQVFSITLPYLVEDLYVQSKVNVNLGSILQIPLSFKNTTEVQLEGSFNRFFNVFTPKDEELNAFTILAPNIMAKMITSGSNYDFEFANNKIFFYFTPSHTPQNTISMTKDKYDEMLQFGINTAKQLARAGRPSKRTETQNVAMWQLFDPTKIANALMIKVGAIIIIFVIPLLWPIGLYFVLRYFRDRAILKNLRRELGG